MDRCQRRPLLLAVAHFCIITELVSKNKKKKKKKNRSAKKDGSRLGKEANKLTDHLGVENSGMWIRKIKALVNSLSLRESKPATWLSPHPPDPLLICNPKHVWNNK